LKAPGRETRRSAALTACAEVSRGSPARPTTGFPDSRDSRALEATREGRQRRARLGALRRYSCPGFSPRARCKFDSLAAHVGWKFAPNIRSRFDTLSFANSDIAERCSAGSRAGRARRAPSTSPGISSAPRAGRIYRYIPAARTGRRVSQGLDPKGATRTTSVRLRGACEFPFRRARFGIFQIVAKVTDADFRYAEGWPQASALSGDLISEARACDIASKGAVLTSDKPRARDHSRSVPRGRARRVEVPREDRRAISPLHRAKPRDEGSGRMTESMIPAGAGASRCSSASRSGIPRRFNWRRIPAHRQRNRTDSDAPPFLAPETGGSDSRVRDQRPHDQRQVSRRPRDDFGGRPARRAIAVNAHGTASPAQIPRFGGARRCAPALGRRGRQGTLTGGAGRPRL